MILYLLAYLGGALTIVSPCILPVLPFVFARAGHRFLTNGLPMLIGMALMFMAVATLAAVGGGWAVAANQYGRAVALVLLALFGLTLLFPHFADRAMRPLVGLGDRLSQRADARGGGVLPSLLLGIASWPIVVLAGLLLLTALFVVVLMVLFRGREMSDTP